jgi:malonyl CoA-acyl carrier protein transacylase
LRVICHPDPAHRRRERRDDIRCADPDEARELCDRVDGELWLSTENSPRASTLSGRRELLERLAVELEGDGVFARTLRVNCGCHSPDMEPAA